MADSEAKPLTTPFAEFERRLAATIIDIAAVFFLSLFLMSNSRFLEGLMPTGRPVLAAVALLYFAGGWASPLSATPAQWALRIRIVDKSCDRIGLGRAVIRAILFIVGALGVMTLAQVPENRWLLVLVAASVASFCIALFTKNRQCLHDLAVQSIAVKSAAIKTPERRSETKAYLEQNAESARVFTRPRPVRVVISLLLLIVFMFGFYNAALVRHEMGLRQRISYAYSETSSLRGALEASYRHTGQWGNSEATLGTPTTIHYTDGGYFMLEDQGVIRIRFTVISDLKRISLVITPRWDGDTLTWNCHAEGNISGGALPANCRD